MLNKNACLILKSNLLKHEITKQLRCVSLVADKISFVDDEHDSKNKLINATWIKAKPYAEVPTYSFWDWSKRISKEIKAKDLNTGEIVEEVFNKTNSEIFKLKIPFVGDQVFVKNPDDVQSLYQNDGKYPIEPVFEFFEYYRNKKRADLFGTCPGLLGTNGKPWAEIRTAVNQDLMRPSSASNYLDDLLDVTHDFINLVNNKTNSADIIDDLTPYCYRHAMESVAVVFLGSRLGCLNDPPSKQAQCLMDNVEILGGDTLIDLLFGFPLWKVIKTKHYKIYDEASEIVFKISADFIEAGQNKCLHQVKKDKERKSLLDKLIDRCGPNSPIPHAMAQDALFAGKENSGAASAFLFYLVATNPEKQELLYKEILEKVPKGESLTVASLMEMKYVKGAMNESLRMIPVAQGTSRKTQKDMVLSGYQIPKGTKVKYETKYTMRKEEYFPQADKFLPERWMRGCTQAKKTHLFAFIPFSHGPRACVGRRIAEMEMQVLLVETLRRYRIEFHGSSPLDVKGGLVGSPDNPLKLKFIPRS